MPLLAALSCSWALSAPVQAAPVVGTPSAKVDELFQTRCMACHVAPDARFAVERAWIAQVADTA
jgi:hypothetical protein